VRYAPGLRTAPEIRTICQAVSKPVNVLARPSLTVADAGARRISVGGALAWTAMDAMVTATERIREHGDFSALTAPTRITDLIGG
jgi:2-methylisocitrate lyase-like PEP mutase family enzyme